MLKFRFSFFAIFFFVGLLAQAQQGGMQSLSPEQMQRLENARRAKLAKQKRTPAQAVPAKQKKAGPVRPGQKVPARKVNPARISVPAKKDDSMMMNTPAPTLEAPPAQRVVRKRPTTARPRSSSFFYVSASYLSFADQIFAKVGSQKEKARSVFTGYSLGSDYTRYLGRYVYSWNLNFVSGVVDIQRVFGTTYPRKSFWGAQSGPELGYRVNSDMDLSWGLNLLYRDIENVGPSFALANQMNIKFRFSPRLTFFQSLGNYGKPTAYSYSIGLRWLL